ncbi:hypothetical protein [Dechloromonas sp. A34]|uniref:hypothetical protein n=1 Tax=Dechloromonas sp. A34 TaxID=447588 RepID=UPI002248E1AE|nr:hypothetical protein [Dechloromonas sp. A34]
MNRSISLHTPHGILHGQLELPDRPKGLILLARAHHAPIDVLIAANLAARGYAIFGMELLSSQEVHFADATQNVPRLSQRLLDILSLIARDGDMQELPLAIFATGDASPAAIRAAAQRDTQVRAVACHGGLIDRAGLQALKLLEAPLLTLFDTEDSAGRTAFQRAALHLSDIHESHVLNQGEDPVLRVAAWFALHLR